MVNTRAQANRRFGAEQTSPIRSQGTIAATGSERSGDLIDAPVACTSQPGRQTAGQIVATLAVLACLAVFVTSASAQVATVTAAAQSTMACPVTNANPPVPKGQNSDGRLAQLFDMAAADQGVSVDDPVHKMTWFFFGDSASGPDHVAWYGDKGADAIGYLAGSDYGNPSSLCNNLQLVTVNGLSSSTGGGVFSPDVVTVPTNDSTSNYAFQPVPRPAGKTNPVLAPNSVIPGTNEGPTGAFFDPGTQKIYIFYFGSPCTAPSLDGTPLGIYSVSYLTVWNPSTTAPLNTSPTTYNVISRVDYNTSNTGVTCPASNNNAQAPQGWLPTAPTPPLGGNVIWVIPVLAVDPTDGKTYVYLFSTGTHRASPLYLARFPAANLATLGQCSSPPCYLAQTANFQVLNSSGQWVSSTANAAPFVFPDDSTNGVANADLGQFSIRYFDQVGLWLMMYTAIGSSNPAFDTKVLVRWALSPTGPWSNAFPVLDLSSTTGSQNLQKYCCGYSSSTGYVCQMQQIMACVDNHINNNPVSVGVPKYGVYAPDMLPNLTNVSSTSTTAGNTTTTIYNFTVSYLLSIFELYDSVLFTVPLHSTVSSAPISLAAAVLPSSRSVRVGTTATAFATIVDAGPAPAVACTIAPTSNVPASFTFQTTDPATNALTGTLNAPATIAPGAAQSFLVALTPTAPFAPTDVAFSFSCSNASPAPSISGVNSLLLSGSTASVPDIVALAATTSADGYVDIPGVHGSGAFVVASVNVGASAPIVVSADTGVANLPLSIALCQTNPSTGQCTSAVGSSVSTMINNGATPTFALFPSASGQIPDSPGINRVFVRFKDTSGLTRGSTSVAVRTQ